jgi:hypothetical protein
MPKFYYFVLFTFAFFLLWTLQVKRLFAQSTTESIIVDGLINEQAWITDSNIALISSCLSLITGNRSISIEVKVLYDNESLHLGNVIR